MSKISKVIARQIFDSRGNPTIEAEVFSKNISSSAICPSGASTGTYEAFEKRDKNDKKYLGKSVLNSVKLINKIISKKLKNQNVHDQEKIDSAYEMKQSLAQGPLTIERVGSRISFHFRGQNIK